jgi:hypothetical protein
MHKKILVHPFNYIVIGSQGLKADTVELILFIADVRLTYSLNSYCLLRLGNYRN